MARIADGFQIVLVGLHQRAERFQVRALVAFAHELVEVVLDLGDARRRWLPFALAGHDLALDDFASLRIVWCVSCRLERPNLALLVEPAGRAGIDSADALADDARAEHLAREPAIH